MEMDERMRVTELVRANWPGVILNNVSATSCQDAQKLLEHSQKAMAGPQVHCIFTSFQHAVASHVLSRMLSVT